MSDFFKVVLSNRKSFVVASNNGYAGLIGLFDGIPDAKNSYIIPLSKFEVLKYLMKK